MASRASLQLPDRHSLPVHLLLPPTSMATFSVAFCFGPNNLIVYADICILILRCRTVTIGFAHPFRHRQVFIIGGSSSGANIVFLDIISRIVSIQKPSCLFFKTQRFGDWILSPSSGKTFSCGNRD
jgi:hypothetical protein